MSTKDNFAQAMKELLNSEGESAKREEKKVAPSSFSSFSQPEPKRPATAKDSTEGEEKLVAPPAPAPAPPLSQAFSGPAAAKPKVAAPAPQVQDEPEIVQEPAPAAPTPVFSEPEIQPVIAQDARPMVKPNATIISEGTVIVGDVSTEGDLQVKGSIKGNVKVAGTMDLSGKVIGDVDAENVNIVCSLVRGNVKVVGSLTVDNVTTIVGDVSARSVDVNGKIKGNVTVEERSHLQSDAVVVGNLVSGTLIIDEGAMLKGDMAITNAQVGDVSVEEPDFEIG